MIYRLNKCPEFSLGLFTTMPSDAEGDNQTEVLMAQILATKCMGEVVTDDAMALPSEELHGGSQEQMSGHQEEGRTIAIHSLAVLPQHQKRGFGKMILKAYVDRMRPSGLADRISLLAHDHLLAFYERAGFENRGQSATQFGGGGWTDLVRINKVGMWLTTG